MKNDEKYFEMRIWHCFLRNWLGTISVLVKQLFIVEKGAEKRKSLFYRPPMEKQESIVFVYEPTEMFKSHS